MVTFHWLRGQVETGWELNSNYHSSSNFYSSTILWLVNVNGKWTLWHKSPQQLISLCSLMCPWLPICDVTWTGKWCLNVTLICWHLPSPGPDMQLSSPVTCDQSGIFQAITFHPPCYGINHSLESRTRTEWVSLAMGHAKHSLESGVWGRNRKQRLIAEMRRNLILYAVSSGELPCMEESRIRTGLTASYIIIAL